VSYSIIPAKAGIQDVPLNRDHVQELDARLRGHDEMRDCPVTTPSLDFERIGSYTGWYQYSQGGIDVFGATLRFSEYPDET
jgi:hypothetical protein